MSNPNISKEVYCLIWVA